MVRSITALALIVLTSTLATAQLPGNAKQINPSIVPPSVKGQVKTQVQPLPGLTGNRADLTEIKNLPPALRPDVGILGGSIVVNEAAKSVSVKIRNHTEKAVPALEMRLFMQDILVDSQHGPDLILKDETKAVGGLAGFETRTITFTGLDYAAFRQALRNRYGDVLNVNVMSLNFHLDPANKVSEKNENNNFDSKFHNGGN